MLANATLGFCFWDLPALILLLAVGFGFWKQQKNHKKRIKELNEKIELANNGQQIQPTP